MKKSVKKFIIPSIYLVAVLSVIGSVYVTVSTVNSYFNKKENFNYSLNDITDTPIKPVQAEEVKDNSNTENISKVLRPYTSEKVSIGRYFYDITSDEEKQENAIILYENTYMPNTGVDYISEEEFDIVSVLPGKVTSVETDEILGNIIKIEHEKDIITVYEGINNINLKVGDEVTAGQIIAKSGTSSINSNYKTSLHFEVYYKGEIIDPEKFYTFNINEL